MYLAQSSSPAPNRGGEIKIKEEVIQRSPVKRRAFFMALLYHAGARMTHTGQQFSAQSGSYADLRIGTLKTHGFA